jgi:hypothetical protein
VIPDLLTKKWIIVKKDPQFCDFIEMAGTLKCLSSCCLLQVILLDYCSSKLKVIIHILLSLLFFFICCVSFPEHGDVHCLCLTIMSG